MRSFFWAVLVVGVMTVLYAFLLGGEASDHPCAGKRPDARIECAETYFAEQREYELDQLRDARYP